MTNKDVRLICFYLPQFYPIAENDIAWGKGYTEWRRVVQAKPLFEGHYQPRLPADLGFYDLRLNETQVEQAKLAEQYGISGFCYYMYWFGNGRRLLERPLNQMVESGQPDFPYCICWANPPWFANWVGRTDCLVKQEYSEESALELIQSLIPMFRDKRYICVDGKPLFIVYVSQALPDPSRYAEIWRKAAQAAGFEDIYLCRVENDVVCDPKSIGFDAAVEIPPSGIRSATIPIESLDKSNGLPGTVYDFEQTAFYAVNKPTPNYKLHRGVFPSWDNSARRPANVATIFHGSTPEAYCNWLSETVEWTRAHHKGDEKLVFINAWNEWGEAAYLEPDLKHGHAYLEATKRALESNSAAPKKDQSISSTNYHLHKRELSDVSGKKLHPSKQIVGSVDQVWKAVDKLCVAGWGCDLDEPSNPVQILLFEDDRLVASERTFISRPDVAQSVNAQAGKAGFHMELNSSAVTKASSLQVLVVSQKARYNALSMNKSSLAAIK